jgi:hypothetical protein
MALTPDQLRTEAETALNTAKSKQSSSLSSDITRFNNAIALAHAYTALLAATDDPAPAPA